jgi:NADH:ubiquinone reductase (H+-translocating)
MAEADPGSSPRPATGAAPTRPRVVIIGGGFGGVACAKALRSAPVDVTLIDRNNYHLFQPLLY